MKILLRLMVVMLGFISCAVFAQFEFGVIDGADCQSQPCKIEFRNKYKEVPVVFLMSSINKDKIADSAPAMAVVKSVDLTTAEVQQINPLGGNTQKMSPIYYMVAEPGKWAPDPTQPDKVVEVGRLTTSHYQRQGNKPGESWDSHSYRISLDDRDPVVLAQIQPDASKTFWVTAAIHRPNSRGFQFALDFGRRPLPDSAQRSRDIGYLVAPSFTGVTASNVDFSFVKSPVTYSQKGGTEGLIESCTDTKIDLPQSYHSYGVIAKKQTRNGGDGGWVRACDLSANNYFTLTLEEDHTNRSHPVPEELGYFVYGSPKIDICEYFPSSLQNNNYHQGKPHAGMISANGDNTEIFLPNRDPLSYDAVRFAGSNSGCVYEGTNREACLVDASLTFPNFPPTLQMFSHSAKEFKCSKGNCILSPGSYSKVEIGKSATLTFLSGEYWIKELELEKSASINTKGQVFVHYQEIDITGSNVRMNAGGYYENLVLIGHGDKSHLAMNKNNLMMKALWYVDSSSAISIQGNGFAFEGSISVQQMLFTSDNHIINAKPPRQCYLPDGRYELTVTPPRDSGLVCGDEKPTFTIVTKKDGVAIMEAVTVDLYDERIGDASYLVASVVDGIGTQLSATQFFTNSSGQLKLEITTTKPNKTKLNSDYILKVVMNQDRRNAVHRNFQFYPFEIVVNDYDIFAGESKNIEAKVLTCNKNNQMQIALQYQGKPDISYELIAPSPLIGGNQGVLVYEPQFKDGLSVSPLTISESGQFIVKLEDKEFDCSGLNNCPVGGSGMLSGEFVLKSRPYKIAICDVKESANPSNINPAQTNELEPGFMAAGKSFSVTYIPIVHPDSKRGADGECSYPITTNYALDNGPIDVSNSLVFPEVGGEEGNITPPSRNTFALMSPTLTIDYIWDEVGTLKHKTSANYLGKSVTADEQNIGRFYPSYFAISESTWHAPDHQNGVTYLSQPFKQAAIKVAPFAYGHTVPVKNYHHFVKDLQATFSVEQDSVVDNELVLTIDNNEDYWQEHASASYWVLNDINARVNRKQSLVGTTITSKENGPFNISTLRDPLSTTTNFGLVIAGDIDPVSFDQNDVDINTQQFVNQPALRYGRMVMGHSGGTAEHDLSIPLRVEYWDGTQFVVNTDDSASSFVSDNSKVCKQVMWSDDSAASNTHLSVEAPVSVPDPEQIENGKIKSGVTLLANKNDPLQREQVRFWLRMDDTSVAGHRSPQSVLADVNCGMHGAAQPWLQYNWQERGDEDPSTVATFGIFRGNDKIIFRSEVGLTGQ